MKTKTIRAVTHIGMVAILVSLSACGGSGGGTSTAPVAVTSPTNPTTPTTPTNPTPPATTPGNLVTTVPAPTTTDPDKAAAYAFLNAQRSQCGFGLLASNTQLETAAQNHANYIGANFAAHSDAYSHTEVASYLNFTGVNPSDRIALTGYAANGGGAEEFASATSGSSVQQTGIVTLLSAGYHLRSLVGGGYYDVGIATAGLVAGANTVVVELGAKTTPLQDVSSADLVSYPCAGSQVKTSAFGIGHESPEPFPARDYSAQPLGQPIYARIRSGQTLLVRSFTVQNSATQAFVPQAGLFTQASDPNHELGANEVLWYPNVPFVAGQSYVVTIVGTNNGVDFTKTFTFAAVS